MTKKTINIGNSANDGNGEPARSAFSKTNDNFGEIYSKLGDGANLFTPIQQGGGQNQSPNKIFIGWSGSGLRAQVDATDLGVVQTEYSNSMLGVGQTWQNFSNQRSKNTAYTNTTGKPIVVTIYLAQTSGTSDISIVVNGAGVCYQNSIGLNFTLSAIVPHGSSYFLSVSENTVISMWSWMELR